MKRIVIIGAALLSLTACGGDSPNNATLKRACIDADVFINKSNAPRVCECVVKELGKQKVDKAYVLEHWQATKNSYRKELLPPSVDSSVLMSCR